MTIWKGRSKKKASGGRYWPWRKKREREIGKDPKLATMGKQASKQHRTTGGHKRIAITKAEYANVASGKTIKKAKILDVERNTASRDYVRRDIITKGAIIKTDIGLARVTSKPTRDGVVNAILIKE